MRIWHKKLIPILCRQHLLACWREGLGAYKILTENKTGYRNHPAVKEFEDHPDALYEKLLQVRGEMLLRGYNPKEIKCVHQHLISGCKLKEWQTLDQQIQILKNKQCDCKLHELKIKIKTK